MSDRNCWGTPSEIFDPLHKAYKFTVDACALPENAKLPHYWTPEIDGLKQNWQGERVWCNPPYGRGLLAPWVWKGLEEFQYTGTLGMVCYILPARTEMDWFHALWERMARGYASIKFLDHRTHFVPPASVKASTPMERTFIALLWA